MLLVLKVSFPPVYVQLQCFFRFAVLCCKMYSILILLFSCIWNVRCQGNCQLPRSWEPYQQAFLEQVKFYFILFFIFLHFFQFLTQMRTNKIKKPLVFVIPRRLRTHDHNRISKNIILLFEGYLIWFSFFKNWDHCISKSILLIF